jgi:hypothetical protein
VPGRWIVVFVFVVGLVGLVAAPAAAEPTLSLADRWPSAPAGPALSLEYQITERLTRIGNELGRHLDLLSREMFQLRVDGHRRRARIRIGGGDAQVLAIRVDSDIQFHDVNARIHARIDLAFHGRRLRLELPTFEMSPAMFRGDYGVEVRLPLFVHSF